MTLILKLQVLFFSVLQDITGTAGQTLEVPDGSKVSDLLDRLYLQWPKLKDWDSSLLIAVDQTYVKRDAPLHDGAEVAIMPPVQGG